jgi:hypothetical protein
MIERKVKGRKIASQKVEANLQVKKAQEVQRRRKSNSLHLGQGLVWLPLWLPALYFIYLLIITITPEDGGGIYRIRHLV